MKEFIKNILEDRQKEFHFGDNSSWFDINTTKYRTEYLTTPNFRITNPYVSRIFKVLVDINSQDVLSSVDWSISAYEHRNGMLVWLNIDVCYFAYLENRKYPTAVTIYRVLNSSKGVVNINNDDKQEYVDIVLDYYSASKEREIRRVSESEFKEIVVSIINKYKINVPYEKRN